MNRFTTTIIAVFCFIIPSYSQTGGLSDSELYNVIDKAAVYFKKNYTKDYCSKVLYLNTVECNGKYREFQGYYGLFGSFDFNQKNHDTYYTDPNSLSHFAPLTVMKSDALNADDNTELTTAKFVRSGTPQYEKLEAQYDNTRRLSALLAKRAVEIYSPLNKAYIDNFSYKLENSYRTDKGTVLVIRFENKPNTYPSKTSIFCTGNIYCVKESGMTIKVTVDELQDAYSNPAGTRSLNPLPSATSRKLEINYDMAYGKVYTSSVSMITSWSEISPGSRNFFYMNGLPRRPSPIANQETEYEYYVFSDPRTLDRKKLESVKKSFIAQYERLETFAPYDKIFWESTELTGIDKQKLIRDLTSHGLSLNQQASANEFKDSATWDIYTPNEISALKEYYNDARRIYSILYGTTWSEGMNR